MNFIATVTEGEDIHGLIDLYWSMKVTNLKALPMIGVITGTSDLTLEELQVPGMIDNVEEDKIIFL